MSHAKAINVDPNLILVRYASERLLYRLSRSPHADRFVLKGGVLMLVWLGETIRPTRDLDLLGFGDLDPATLAGAFAEICAIPGSSTTASSSMPRLFGSKPYAPRMTTADSG